MGPLGHMSQYDLGIEFSVCSFSSFCPQPVPRHRLRDVIRIIADFRFAGPV